VIVRGFADYPSLSFSAAQLVAELIRSKPHAVIGLAAGNTPVGTYQELVRRHREENLDFSGLTLFTLDEYEGLDETHPQSFARFFRERLLDHINVPARNVHLLSEDTFPAYEQSIKDAGGIDLQILGIGKNGHIAFNEPGSSFASRTRRVTLAHQGAPGTPLTAITMGVETILEARRVLLLSAGPEKTAILAAAVHGPITESVPASVLQRHREVTVLYSSEL
jgi:glucosamine-6-phosphate deaminase